MVSTPNVTVLLGEWSRGDRTALSQLLPVVYAELRASRRGNFSERAGRPHLAAHRPGARGLHPARRPAPRRLGSHRAHFFGVAAQVMRRILVDHARRHNAVKRGRLRRVAIDEARDIAASNDVAVLECGSRACRAGTPPI